MNKAAAAGRNRCRTVDPLTGMTGWAADDRMIRKKPPKYPWSRTFVRLHFFCSSLPMNSGKAADPPPPEFSPLKELKNQNLLEYISRFL